MGIFYIGYMEIINQFKQNITRLHSCWNFITSMNDTFIETTHLNLNDVRLNYLSEGFGWLSDTLPTNWNNLRTDTSLNHLSDIVGLLEIMYIQQDIILRICDVFNIDNSIKHTIKHDSRIRTLRNTTAGHPLNFADRDTRYRTSVLFHYAPMNERSFSYIIYGTCDNHNIPVKHTENIDDIYTNNCDSLNFVVTKIIEVCEHILRQYKEAIINLRDVQLEHIQTEWKKLNKNDIYELNNVNIKSLFNDNPRYAYYKEYISDLINTYINDSLLSVNELLCIQDENITDDNDSIDTEECAIEFTVVDSDDISEHEKKSNCILYYIRNILTHNCIGCEYDLLCEYFTDNELISNELNYLSGLYDDESEFIISSNYLNHLIEICI